MDEQEILKLAHECFKGLFNEQGNVTLPNGVRVKHKENLLRFARRCHSDGWAAAREEINET